MSNRTPVFKRDYAIQGRRTILTSFISFDGEKWIPYGEYIRNIHVMLARRSARMQNGNITVARAQNA